MFSILGFLALVADIWAIWNVMQSRASSGAKVLWVAVILIFPYLGFVIWFFAGPRQD
ncbi:MAG TPA: PLDc N-terminal domain-containing protein [Gemmatimonadota bacterium]|nr:PLDc N-terminal domain-containing protein [Gemmatimonadota bacterium]